MDTNTNCNMDNPHNEQHTNSSGVGNEFYSQLLASIGQEQSPQQRIERFRPNISTPEALSLLVAFGKRRCAGFTIDEGNRFTIEQAVRWLIADPSTQAIHPETGAVIQADLTKGLYISGTTGSGKTLLLHLLRDLSQHLRLMARLYDSTKYSWDTLPLLWRVEESDNIADHYATTGEIKSYKDRPILTINDLGREPQEALYMGNRITVCKAILEHRGDRIGQLNLATSNLRLGGNHFRERYGDRVQSRLMQMCNVLELVGIDRRRPS